jgi:hypothetical protein
MDKSKDNDSIKCLQNCEQLFRECLYRGNEEVYCRIQRVPCDSSCNKV